MMNATAPCQYSVIENRSINFSSGGDISSNTNGPNSDVDSVVAELKITVAGQAVTITNSGFNYVEAGTNEVTKSTSFNIKILSLLLDNTNRYASTITFTTTPALASEVLTSLQGKSLHSGATFELTSLNEKQVFDKTGNTAVALISVKKPVMIHLSQVEVENLMNCLSSYCQSFSLTGSSGAIDMIPEVAFSGTWEDGEIGAFVSKPTNKAVIGVTSPNSGAN